MSSVPNSGYSLILSFSYIHTLSLLHYFPSIYKIFTRLYAYKFEFEPLNHYFSLAHLQTHKYTKPIKSVLCIVKVSKHSCTGRMNLLTNAAT